MNIREEQEKRIAARFVFMPGYEASPDSLKLVKQKQSSKGEPEYEIISNGVVLLNRVIEIDNGIAVKTELELEAIYTCLTGECLIKPFRIKQEDLSATRCFPLPPGFRLNPSKYGAAKFLVDTITAQADICPRERIYTHTGWREIDGKRVFLHAGGAVGADKPLTVELGEGLSRYCFSEGNHADKWKVFKKLFEVASREIMYPLVAFAALSPLNYYLANKSIEPAFIMYLFAKTQTGKSTLAALMLSFFGRFNSKALPSSIKDTSYSIEVKGNILGDVLTVIDDYHPVQDSKEQKEMSAKVQYLLRSYGDRTGRARLNSDATLKDTPIPKGNALMCGEMYPDVGESGLARMFIVRLPHNVTTNNPALNYVQKRSDRLAECMRDYILWLTENADTDKMESIFYKYREEAQSVGCGRCPEQIAHLMVSVCIGMSFLVEKGIIPAEQSAVLTRSAWKTFVELGKEQFETTKNLDPVKMFLDGMTALIQTRALSFFTNYNSRLNKWSYGYYIKEEGLFYLLWDNCYRAVNEWLRKTNRAIPVDSITLRERLVEEGFVVPSKNGKAEWQKHLKHSSPRLVRLKESALPDLGQIDFDEIFS